MKNTDPPHGNHHHENADASLNPFIEGMGMYFESEGVPRIGGRILGLLLAAPGPLSAEELAGRLKVSRASISTNIRMLTATGLVEKVAFLDKRQTHYAMTGDVWGRAIAAGREKILAFRSIAETGLAALPAGNEARGRLEEMIEWSNFMSGVYEKVLREWQARRPDRTPAERKAG
ncbi:MAG: GbsR/MarR family transcriptional regulator [Bacteroidota bacterium]